MALRTPSIRTRLAGWYTLALAAMLLVYAASSYFIVRHALLSDLDELLEDDLYSARAALHLGDRAQVTWQQDSRDDTADNDDRGEDVWLTTGETIHRSRVTASLPGPPSSPVSSPVDLVDARGVHWRAVDAVVSIGPHTAIVRVARSAERLHEDLFELSVVLLGGIPVMLFIAGMAGFGLADRVLRPIDLLARDAERITADRLHERLSSPNPHDEIGRLTAVFNAAFQRIASAFDQLRRFTADASHELRTPLSVVRGIGEATLAQPRTPAEYQDSIGSMLEEVERMTGLVNALLRLTNADAGEIGVRQTVIDLAPIAAAVVASLTILAEEKGQTLQLDGDAVEVTGDALLVREALSNIVDNAIKYSPRGSLTHVRVRREGEWGVVTVDDQGPGIDPRYRDRVFDRFFRIDEARSRETGGSGLGLAIARWAIESSGGQISVEEGRAGGACFRIALPLASTGVAT